MIIDTPFASAKSLVADRPLNPHKYHSLFLYTATDSNDPTLSSHPSITFHLVLRKWANLNPAMEFRLFAGNKSILGICQRDCSTYYDFLINEMDDLEDLLVAFWTTKVSPPESYPLSLIQPPSFSYCRLTLNCFQLTSNLK